MGQNTKIAGYNAEATPLAGVNSVHTIQFGICITGRKNADTPETVETKLGLKDKSMLEIKNSRSIEGISCKNNHIIVQMMAAVMINTMKPKINITIKNINAYLKNKKECDSDIDEFIKNALKHVK